MDGKESDTAKKISSDITSSFLSTELVKYIVENWVNPKLNEAEAVIALALGETPETATVKQQDSLTD